MTDANKLHDEVEAFLASGCNDEERENYLDRLLELHEKCKEVDEESAEDLREAFLLALDDRPAAAHEPRFCAFLCEHIAPSDFAKLSWQSPQRVTKFCEIIYGFQFPNGETAERMRACLATLLRTALRAFEEKGEYEQMLYLVQTVPTSPAILSGELLRLRNRVHLYEMSRVRRNKRLLYAYLVIHTIFVVVIFPLLFVYAENGAIRDAVQEVTDVKLPEKQGRQYLTYSDGLYWSVITAASIGYGDVTPRSNEGRIIAAVLGTMGVLTIGIVAGLVLIWITPRRLD